MDKLSDKQLWRSKKAWSVGAGAVTLIVLAALKADPTYAMAAAMIFAGHQAAQGVQDALKERAGRPPPG